MGLLQRAEVRPSHHQEVRPSSAARPNHRQEVLLPSHSDRLQVPVGVRPSSAAHPSRLQQEEVRPSHRRVVRPSLVVQPSHLLAVHQVEAHPSLVVRPSRSVPVAVLRWVARPVLAEEVRPSSAVRPRRSVAVVPTVGSVPLLLRLPEEDHHPT